MVTLPEDMYFPTFEFMKECDRSCGGVFTFEIIGGRRMTIVTDPKLLDLVFSPGEYSNDEAVGDAVTVEMDKLAYAWFGIPKEICGYTRVGLNATRKILAPDKVRMGHAVGTLWAVRVVGLCSGS